MKRLIYLLTIIGVIAIVVGGFYFLRYRAESGPEEAPTAPGGLPQTPPQTIPAPPAPGGDAPLEQPSGEVVQPGEQKFGAIAKNEVLSYFVDGQNNAIIVQPDGQIVKIVRGEASVLSSSLASNLMSAEFSYDGKYILAAFGNRSEPQYSVFSVETKSWKPLASGIKSAAWSPADYRIAYFKEQVGSTPSTGSGQAALTAGGSTALTTLDLQNEKAVPQEITKIRVGDADIFWPFANQLLVSDKPSALYAGSIWSVDITKKTLAATVVEQLGLSSAWNQAAEMGLVFRTDLSRRGGRLSLLGATGNVLSDFAFLTLPSKCAFATEHSVATSTADRGLLYCAVPRDQEELEIKTLPDEYIKRSFFTQDNFYQINLVDGGIKEVLSDQAVDGDGLKVFGKNLFFVNRLDGKLYAISLE